MGLFLIPVDKKVKFLLNELGFKDIKIISKNTDTTKNCIVFSYKGTQGEREWPIFVELDFDNYKNNSDFSDILVSCHMFEDKFPVFNESCEDLKEPYFKLVVQLEHEILSTSLEINSICNKNKKRI